MVILSHFGSNYISHFFFSSSFFFCSIGINMIQHDPNQPALRRMNGIFTSGNVRSERGVQNCHDCFGAENLS